MTEKDVEKLIENLNELMKKRKEELELRFTKILSVGASNLSSGDAHLLMSISDEIAGLDKETERISKLWRELYSEKRNNGVN